jgi:DNA topoisomerase-2
MEETKSLSKKYQKKTDIEHVKDNPDTYIGSIEQMVDTVPIYVDELKRITLSKITIINGLNHLFNEALTNASDHVIRMNELILNASSSVVNYPVTKIDITVENGQITICNDGNGIDVAEHPEHKIWIPEMIFANLRTSSNYNKDEKRIVGGKNGFGIKLVFIWSTYGYIETVDAVRGLKYFQEFKSNLSEICPPIVTPIKKSAKPYTKISFIPDYERFGIPEGLTDDMVALFKKRTCDISACSGSVKVQFNNMLLNVINFQQLVDLYIGPARDKNAPETVIKRIYESPNERWEYVVCLANEKLVGLNNQVSLVNGICTHKGGRHVDYIMNQIVRKIITVIETKKKIKVDPKIIKDELFIFLRCNIENPSFSSQTKDYLDTPVAKFGSTCIVSDEFVEKVSKLVITLVCSIAEIKESVALDKAAKKQDGKKSKKIYGIHKLIDANWAGGDKSERCTLILCEGDSAKSGIVSGLTSEDRNVIGIFPLKGKLLNVRGEKMEKILLNEEIGNIKKILGLGNKTVYERSDIKKLRYGKVLILTDADVDGSHIKGLCINLFDVLWPSLLQIENFIGYMNTPILKVRKGKNEIVFYNEGEYKSWKDTMTDTEVRSWNIKYYKGLGTSTGKEFKQYFEHKKIVNFVHTEQSDDTIDMIFNKLRAGDRKKLLMEYTPVTVDTSLETINYEYFINNELIIFSKYDCTRSIPNIMDGLKTSTRKILYVVMKKNITSEVKVAQLGALIAQHSSYHHGEISLIGAIIGMAQDFIGANNINLLMPNGQFGTRRQGGDDAASERYIYTEMNKITRHIFIPHDDNVLHYLDDDGVMVEPEYYAPIIPMILVNGSKGIGTGFSTEILCYNPQEIIKYLKFKLAAMANIAMADIAIYPEYDKLLLPYYKHFKGEVLPYKDKFLIKGIYKKIKKDTISITELPVGMWTEDFRKLLDTLMGEDENKKLSKKECIVKDYDDMSNDKEIDFTVTLHDGMLDKLESELDKTKDTNLVYKVFRLATTVSTSNMHLFDTSGRLKKYSSIIEIIDEYFATRLHLYQVRKDYLIEKITHELLIIENKVRYIREVLESTIDIRRMKKDNVYKLLTEKNYALIDGEYSYLIKLPMDSVTEEKIEEMEKKYQDKRNELDEIINTTIQNLWIKELDILYSLLDTEAAATIDTTTATATSSKTTATKTTATKTAATKTTSTKATSTKTTATKATATKDTATKATATKATATKATATKATATKATSTKDT